MLKRLWCWLLGGHVWVFDVMEQAWTVEPFPTHASELPKPYCARCGARMEA